jgi:hypothetical protein
MSKIRQLGRAALEALRGNEPTPRDRFQALGKAELIGAFAVAWDTALLAGTVHLLRAYQAKQSARLSAGGLNNDEMREIVGRMSAAGELERELIGTVERAQKEAAKVTG